MEQGREGGCLLRWGRVQGLLQAGANNLTAACQEFREDQQWIELAQGLQKR